MNCSTIKPAKNAQIGAISSRNIDARTESADDDAGEESTQPRRGEVPRKSATQCEDHVEHADEPPHVAADAAIAGLADDECSGRRARRCNDDGRTDTGRREGKNIAQRSRDAGDDGRVKPNNIAARLAIMTIRKYAEPPMDFSPNNVKARRRLLGIHKTSYCEVSAMSLTHAKATMLRAPGG